MTTKRYHLPYLEEVRSQRHVCFAEQLRSANRAVSKLYTQHLGDSDIGITQLSLLIRLYYFGAPPWRETFSFWSAVATSVSSGLTTADRGRCA